MLFCALNLIYIPGAFIVHPNWSDVIVHGLVPNLPGGFSGQMFFFLMANIGTTIAPWMLFFQQSSHGCQAIQPVWFPRHSGRG